MCVDGQGTCAKRSNQLREAAARTCGSAGRRYPEEQCRISDHHNKISSLHWWHKRWWMLWFQWSSSSWSWSQSPWEASVDQDSLWQTKGNSA